MNPYLQLRRLLGREALQTTGTIIEALRNSIYRVRTASGSLQAAASGNVVYAIGDEVLVVNGVIQGRVKSPSSVASYDV